MKYDLNISEASLGRVYQHVVGHPKVKSWGMITAYRASNSKQENITANKELQADLKAAGLGFFKINGHWQECQDTLISYNDCPSDKLIDATEITLFVPNITKAQINSLTKKYNQDAAVHGDEKTPGGANLIFKDGSVQYIGKFHPQKVSQAYSGIKTKTFMFKKNEPTDTKLKSLIPKRVLDKMIRNPKTGRNIKVKSALRYDKTNPMYKAAKSMVQKVN